MYSYIQIKHLVNSEHFSFVHVHTPIAGAIVRQASNIESVDLTDITYLGNWFAGNCPKLEWFHGFRKGEKGVFSYTANSDLTDKYYTYTVTNSMGWPISTIKETALLYGDGPFGSNLKSSDYVPEGVRVIRLGNILQGAFSEKDRSFVSYEKYESLKRYECKPGQVVIATLGDPLLRACLVPDFGVPSIHKADCMYYETDPEKVLPLFAVNVINHPTMLERAGVDGHGQTRQRINSTQTGNLPMILPPIALQQEFVTFVQQVDKLKFETQQAIEKLQLLYDSLAQEYFGS